MPVADREGFASVQSEQRDKGVAVVDGIGSTASGGKTKRHTWSFINVSPFHDAFAASKRGRELASPVAFKNTPPFDLTPSSASQTRVGSSEPQPQPRPRSSRGRPPSTPQVLTFSNTSTRGLPTILEAKGLTASMESSTSRGDGGKVKRWDGHTRTTSPWNGIRRDPELFYDRGNCIIHLYAKGQSQRGPSMRIPLDTIYNARFEFIFGTFLAELQRNGSRRRLLPGAPRPSKSTLCDLYIPSPDHVPRASALSWHLTTRNFFAFLMDKPLVGGSLSQALLDLQARLDIVRPNDPDNRYDVMNYFERSGYLDFSHCPDYALAFLRFAERSELYDLWVDAFVHSVGMNEMLTLSPEFDEISHFTKALITRAYLDMDLHLGRVTNALSNFLEEDFSPAYLGLSNGQRAHLDRFRSFLHTYYVEKFGYWPPPPGSRFSKSLYKSMYFDFRSLYDFLVDLDSNESLVDQKPASGGICVLQNVQAFDARHKYIPLPHPLPLLPEVARKTQRSPSQRALRSLKIGGKASKNERYFTARDALAAATNSNDVTVNDAPLVKEYQKFERECARLPEEKVSIQDARRVRWIVIYGTLQMLVSVIRAPTEVRDVDTPTYPLCCLVSRLAPWLGGSKSLIAARDSTENFDPSQLVPEAMDISPIQPDCEGDEYFTHTHAASDTVVSPIQRTASDISIPSLARPSMFRHSSLKSVTSFTLSPFVSRRGSQIVKPSAPAPLSTTPRHMPIVVLGYGNGLSSGLDLKSNEIPIEYSTETFPEVVPEIAVSAHSPPNSRPGSSHFQEPAARRTICTGQLITPESRHVQDPQRTPTLNCADIDRMHSAMSGRVEESDYPSDASNSTTLTPIWSSRSNSTSSSYSVENTNTRLARRASIAVSTFSTNSTTLLDRQHSPVELPIDKDGGITVSRSFSVERSSPREDDIREDTLHLERSPSMEIGTDSAGPRVYQPSGYRSNSLVSNLSQFSGYRSNSVASISPSVRRHSIASSTLSRSNPGSLRSKGFGSLRNSGFGTVEETSETGALAPEIKPTPEPTVSPINKNIVSRADLPSVKASSAKPTSLVLKEVTIQPRIALRSSLKRSDAVAGIREKKRSVRIKDDVDLFPGINMNGIVA